MSVSVQRGSAPLTMEAVRLEKRNAVLKALKEALTLLEAHGAGGCYDRADVIEEAKVVAKDVLRILDARAAELLAAPPEGEGAGGGDGNADPDPDPNPINPGDGGGAGEESEDEDLSTRRDRLVCEAECGSEVVWLSDSDDAGQSEHGEPDTEAAVTRQQSQAAEGEGEGEEGGGSQWSRGSPSPQPPRDATSWRGE